MGTTIELQPRKVARLEREVAKTYEVFKRSQEEVLDSANQMRAYFEELPPEQREELLTELPKLRRLLEVRTIEDVTAMMTEALTE